MKRIIPAFLLLAAVCVDASAQGSATFHVFPQLADGLQDASSGYVSVVLATNTSNASAECTMHYYGNGLASRFPPNNKFTLPAQGFPPNFNGGVIISSSSPFSVLGLVFIGNIFLSEPAAILQ